MNQVMMSVASVLAVFLGAADGAAQAKPDPIVISCRIDGESASITVKGDDVRIEIDGKDVTEKRSSKQGNSIVVKDEAGAVAAYLTLVGRGVCFRPSMVRQRAAIGVQIGALPGALAAHLELDSKAVIYITGVTSGRAASKAGVRSHDVILELDGKSPVSEAVLRSLLKTKKPGAELTLKVLRRGRAIDVTVKCDRATATAFDRAKWDSLSFPTANNLLRVGDTLLPYWNSDLNTVVDPRFSVPFKLRADSATSDYWSRVVVGSLPDSTKKGATKGAIRKPKAKSAPKAKLDLQLKVLEQRFDRLERMIEKLSKGDSRVH